MDNDDLGRAIDALSGFVWTVLPEEGATHLNQFWCDYTGLTQDESRGHGWQIAIHPTDRPQFVERFQCNMSVDQTLAAEARLRRFDGEYRWFLFNGRPVIAPSGKLAKWCGIATDINERRQAEALLAQENRLLEMVADGSPLMLVLKTLCEVVEYNITGAYCGVLLIDPSGAHLHHVAAPTLPSGFTKSLHGRALNVESGPCAMAAYLREQVISPDITLETRWGTTAWCPLALAYGLRAAWSTPILSKDGRALGSFAIYYREPRSPTALHQALIERFTHIARIAIERAEREAAVHRGQLLLTEAQRLSSTGSFFWQVANNSITWSAEIYRIFELDPAVPLTLEIIATRVHPHDLASFSKMMNNAAQGDGREFEIASEHRLQMPSGSVKYLRTVARGTFDEEGRLEYFGAVQDVTERRVAERALEKARTELAHAARVTSLGALTASIAHEVNQPLSGIINNASACELMLEAEPPDVAGARETARRTIRDANRASDVITRLRALFGNKEITSEFVDLNDATREVIALSSGEMQNRLVVVDLDLADDLPPVIGDRVQLQQVVLNLLLNASDAMRDVDDRPRRLIVSTARDGGESVYLTVKDAGIGLDPDNVDKVFDAFYTTKDDGMGIGLSVSRSIIESHQGRIWAEPNDGPGATFAFSIPRRPEQAMLTAKP